MKNPFHKFPHTPHLIWLGEGAPPEDKIMSRTEAEEFLEQPLVIEEKVNGASRSWNIGRVGV